MHTHTPHGWSCVNTARVTGSIPTRSHPCLEMHALWQRLLIKVSAKWHILNTQYNDSLPWRRPLKQEILTRKRYPHRCCQCNGYVSCIYSSTPIYSPPFLVSSTTLSVSLPLFLSITLSLSLFLYLPPSTSVSQSISDCA